MELSTTRTREAKKLNITTSYLVMADLISIGYSENDAYVIAYPENAALSVQQNNSIRNTIVNSAKFKKLIGERRNRVKDGIATPATLDEVELVGTDEVLKEILRSAKQQPVGSKERADLYAKYNEIKKDSDASGSNIMDSISFMLPMKCSQCPLFYAYNDFLKRKGEREVRPAEMPHIMAITHSIIQAARDAE